MPDEIPEHLEDMWLTFTASMGIIADKQALTLQDIINRMLSSGMSKAEVKANLIQDLREGGQIFGDFRKQFKSTVKWGVEETARRESTVGVDLDTELWEWLAIADNKICGDCADRALEEPKKYAEWQTAGLPGSGATVCQQNCRCRLVILESIEKPKSGIVLSKQGS